MSKIEIIFLTFFLLGPAQSKDFALVRQDKRNDLIYTEELRAHVPDESAPSFIKYRLLQGTFNPHASYPFSVITQTARDSSGNVEFNKTYHTNHLGLRVVEQKKSAQNFLIMAGDSNVYGIGSNDEETITARLNLYLPKTQVINLGIPGSAGNSLLFFLENYHLKELVRGQQKGVMLYDFSPYLMERMIGSKNFVRWGRYQPAYEINDQNQVKFVGSFNSLLITQFYKLLGLIDPDNFLFPNLPQIHQHHMKLIARIFLEIKNRFLQQMGQKNRFAILINPFVLNAKNWPLMKLQAEEFQKLGMRTIFFSEKETYPIEIYPKDLHRTPKGQDYYARMIAKKIQDLYNFPIKI